jgi:hypothetical protein
LSKTDLKSITASRRYGLAIAIPVDVGLAWVIAGRYGGVLYAVGDDVVVFEVSGMAVAKGYIATLIVP